MRAKTTGVHSEVRGQSGASLRSPGALFFCIAHAAAHTVDVAILKDRFGKTLLRYAQHGATYAFSRCHVVREKHLPQRIEGLIKA